MKELGNIQVKNLNDPNMAGGITCIASELNSLPTEHKAIAAAREFAECQIKCEVLLGQLMAERERREQLAKQMNDVMNEYLNGP